MPNSRPDGVKSLHSILSELLLRKRFCKYLNAEGTGVGYDDKILCTYRLSGGHSVEGNY